MKKRNVNSIIIDLLREKPVSFNPALGRIIESATAGLFMSQLLYWWDKGHKKGCIYKTMKEFKKETCLTRSEQDTAIKKWKQLGVLAVENKGIPQKRHFYINIEKMVGLLEKRASEKNIDGFYIEK